jgi:hypothetical protein
MKHIAFLFGLAVTANACCASERLDNLTLEQATRIALQNHRSMQVAQTGLQLADTILHSIV